MSALIHTSTSLIQEYAAFLIALVAIGGAIGLFDRKVIRPLTARARKVLDSFEAMSNLVQAQLTINGGGSLLDKVNQIEPNRLRSEEHWNENKTIAMALADKVEATRSALEARVEQARVQLATTLEATETSRWASLDQRLHAIEIENKAAALARQTTQPPEAHLGETH